MRMSDWISDVCSSERLGQSSHHFAGQPISNGQAHSTQSSDHVTALPHGRSSGSGHSRDSVANLRRVATEVERRRAGTVFAGWRLPIPILLIARLSAVSGARTALDQPRHVVEIGRESWWERGCQYV